MPTKRIMVGNVAVGGGSDISIQSMLNAAQTDFEASIGQAQSLCAAGCNIIRTAVLGKNSLRLISLLKEKLSVPIVADIHFDYRLALESIAAGADKIRINPGNIGDEKRVEAVVRACQKSNLPIRIGVNSGSLEKELIKIYGAPTPRALVESAKRHTALLEKFDFTDIVVSIKSSDVLTMITANRIAAKEMNYPLHLGVTEAGGLRQGIVKSAIGIGALLAEGIGDTIRVSLTSDPVDEISAAKDILKALGKPGHGVQIISCPTCARTQIDVIGLSEEVEKALEGCKKNIKVAVMGCAVNGPGEAREADVGIAAGAGKGVLFVRGEVVKTVEVSDIISELIKAIEELDETVI
jgi:(E)-4-hydroxy-3-methylbut-2-enyl-diphosphate synthase